MRKSTVNVVSPVNSTSIRTHWNTCRSWALLLRLPTSLSSVSIRDMRLEYASPSHRVQEL